MNCSACLRLLSILTILLILAACATLPEDFERPESFAYSDTDKNSSGTVWSMENRRSLTLNPTLVSGAAWVSVL